MGTGPCCQLQKTSVCWAVAFAWGTRCHLSVHSLAQRYARTTCWWSFRDNEPCSRSDNAAGHHKTSRDGGQPSSASHGVVQHTSTMALLPMVSPSNNGSRHGLGAEGAASNMAPCHRGCQPG